MSKPPKVKLVMVSTINGKITKNNSDFIYDWTSKEDKDQFLTHISKAKFIVMGSSTFLANKQNIKPNKKQFRLVLTRNINKYNKYQIKDQLEFDSLSPNQVISFALKKNIKEILLLGGGVVNSLFLKENLVDQLVLTIEPKIFGRGKDLAEKGHYFRNFILKKIEKLNKTGTILLTYEKSK